MTNNTLKIKTLHKELRLVLSMFNVKVKISVGTEEESLSLPIEAIEFTDDGVSFKPKDVIHSKMKATSLRPFRNNEIEVPNCNVEIFIADGTNLQVLLKDAIRSYLLATMENIFVGNTSLLYHLDYQNNALTWKSPDLHPRYLSRGDEDYPYIMLTTDYFRAEISVMESELIQFGLEKVTEKVYQEVFTGNYEFSFTEED